MKTKFLNSFATLFIAAGLLLGACSKDDENDIDPDNDASLEEASLSLAEDGSTELVEIPEGLASSEDEYAQQVVGYIESVNSITNYMSYFTPPANAEKSGDPIVASNGRAKATKRQYLVYRWIQGDYSIAYQLSSEDGKYIWEIFWKQGDGDYLKYIHAEESKTAKVGLMKIYNIFTGDGELLLDYTWDINREVTSYIKAKIYSGEESLSYDLTLNHDLSGEIEYKSNEEIFYHMNWSGHGSGNWTWYSEGEVAGEGSWEV